LLLPAGLLRRSRLLRPAGLLSRRGLLRRSRRLSRLTGRSSCHGQVGVTRHRQPAVGAEAVFAAVDGGAPGAGRDSCLAQHSHGLALLQRRLYRPQLVVDVAERAELREHQRVVSGSEAVQVVDQAAQVPVGQLAGTS
jgi:hypothetical protein